MKCFKRNQCKGKPGVCPQKRLTPIKAPVFLLAVFIILSMATVVIAQSQELPQSPLTLQEERIINYCRKLQKKYEPSVATDFEKELEHYMRDGCKKALGGNWRWDTWRDIITITYNADYKVFLGNVTRPVKMDLKPGHLLFKVYFSRSQPILSYYDMTCKGISVFDSINNLRVLKDCYEWQFTGTEFAFDERTKKPTAINLLLILQGDRIEYKVEKDAYYLTRIK